MPSLSELKPYLDKVAGALAMALPALTAALSDGTVETTEVLVIVGALLAGAGYDVRKARKAKRGQEG